MAEKTANRKKYLVMLSATLGVALVFSAARSFPAVEFYGQTVWLFAPERLVRPYLISGRVLGDHIFETEYGEIRLKRSSLVGSIDNTIDGIEAENFVVGLATHDLIIGGIKIPPSVYIGFKHPGPNQITLLADFGDQEIMVSNIPLNLSKLDLRGHLGNGADITVDAVSFPLESITLADSTELEVSEFFGDLFMHKGDGVWRLQVPSYSTFLIKLPGATEFTRYKSITFGENWGGFIEGELFVPEDPEAERKEMDKMLNDLSNSISIYGSRN